MSRRNSNTELKKLLKVDAPWGDTLVMGTAELIGTAIFVFVGCMGCVGSASGTPPHLQVALTFGFVVAAIVQMIVHISGSHINPAVTICTIILGLKSITTGGVYIIGQFLGAILGYGLLRAVIPAQRLYSGNASTSDSFCVTMVHDSITPMQGLLIEAVTTGVLIIFVCSCVDPRNASKSDSVPVKFGFVVSSLALASGVYTGCSMNPARSFAPALWTNDWTLQWVYWLGPIAGSVIASLIYKLLFWPKQVPKENIPEAVPLNSLSVDTEKPEIN